MTSALGEHFFRHEFGRLVALISRRVGVQHLELVEDAVQSALLAAVESWGKAAVPENPSAWLFRVAQNHFVGELRRRARHEKDAVQNPTSNANDEELPVFLTGDVEDCMLRMLFVCCDEALPAESQLVLALKTLCGFDVSEIAQRLFMSEANVYKRLERARNRLREVWPRAHDVTTGQLATRLPAVQTVLYTLFTEGYLSSHAEQVIRQELCDEARRLARILAEHSVGATPETFALLALMHLHAARMRARQDSGGGLLLLEEQDRSLYDPQEIAVGLSWLARSAVGNVFSRYHAEAGIAAEHCLSPSFAETRWERIVECYDLLDRLAPSVLHTLNRALAVAECRGAERGLALVQGLEPPAWLSGSHLWFAVLADLHRRCGHAELAMRYADSAIELAPSAGVQAALRRRLHVEAAEHCGGVRRKLGPAPGRA